jgi:hypothetical protein
MITDADGSGALWTVSLFSVERAVGLPFRKQTESGASITKLIVEREAAIVVTIV